MTGRLHELGLLYGADKATHHGFCDFYEKHLPTRINRLLEVGVMDGASLRMWRDYYPQAEIVGVDIRACNPVEGCTVLQGDATDPVFLATLGRFDVIVDDGSHMTADQQATFDSLAP
jgi:23S rRNA U2552 (ribose-2'-O)-methylase RlmE/FtsJ